MQVWITRMPSDGGIMLDTIRLIEIREGSATHQYAVECPKHKEIVGFEFEAGDYLLQHYPRTALEVAAQEALMKFCSGCIRNIKLALAPKQWTGWPDEAEL
jgi:hypothetical protein